MLTELAALADADTVIIDSLKDAALNLADDETGSGWNRARQMCIQAGVELVELHHPRKAQGDNKKPSKLEDLYGQPVDHRRRRISHQPVGRSPATWSSSSPT